MGFYELGNGCDSCDTISSVLPNNVNMDSGYGSQYGNQYGSQATPMSSQYNTTISSGYGAQGQTTGRMGNGSTGSTMGATTMTTTVPTTIVQTIPNSTIQQASQQAMKQVTAAGPAMVLVPASTVSGGKVEGFTSTMNTSYGSSSGSSSGSISEDKKWILLGLVVFCSLASNECCKYFLNKSLQLNDGSPMYYFAYAAVAVLLTIAAYTYATKN